MPTLVADVAAEKLRPIQSNRAQGALGSVEALVDDNGLVTDSYSYDEYGVPLHASGNTYNPYRYVGALGVRWDEAARLYYMRYRWYDAEVGMFAGRDPMRVLAGVNLYRYADGNPLRYVDPIGLAATTCPSFKDCFSRCLDAGGLGPVAIAAVAGSFATAFANWKTEFVDALGKLRTGPLYYAGPINLAKFLIQGGVSLATAVRVGALVGQGIATLGEVGAIAGVGGAAYGGALLIRCSAECAVNPSAF